MKDHFVRGGGGIRLHVAETGTPRGKPILFIHGTSQCSLAWREQMRSDLANDFRLVAMDLRGHGASEKPRDVYGDSRLWADDVRAGARGVRGDTSAPASGERAGSVDRRGAGAMVSLQPSGFRPLRRLCTGAAHGNEKRH